MSRTIQDVTIVNKNIIDTKEFISNWFSQNKFEVLDWESNGIEKKHGNFFTKMILKPHIGSIVALSYKQSGVVVFEVSLKSENSNTLVHGEFYAGGATIFAGNEFDLSPKPPFTGIWPRKRGYKAMCALLDALNSFSDKRT
jgi:hypothetical protein